MCTNVVCNWLSHNQNILSLQLLSRQLVLPYHVKLFNTWMDLCVYSHHCKMLFHLRYIHGDRSRRCLIHLGSCTSQVGDKNHKCQRDCMGPSHWRAMLRKRQHKTQKVCKFIFWAILWCQCWFFVPQMCFWVKENVHSISGCANLLLAQHTRAV